METYDIYEVYYHGKIDDNIDMKNGVDLFYFVRDNGDWDLVKTYNNEKSAYKMWDERWSKKAKTEIDEDDNNFFSATIYVFERTIRDENEEPIDSVDIDGSVFALD